MYLEVLVITEHFDNILFFHFSKRLKNSFWEWEFGHFRGEFSKRLMYPPPPPPPYFVSTHNYHNHKREYGRYEEKCVVYCSCTPPPPYFVSTHNYHNHKREYGRYEEKCVVYCSPPPPLLCKHSQLSQPLERIWEIWREVRCLLLMYPPPPYFVSTHNYHNHKREYGRYEEKCVVYCSPPPYFVSTHNYHNHKREYGRYEEKCVVYCSPPPLTL